MSAKQRRRKADGVYTPPGGRRLRHRPPWHRAMGFAVLIVGLGVGAVNLVTEFTKAELLPGGRSPLYLAAGIVVACYSMWWFGWFDRPT